MILLAIWFSIGITNSSAKQNYRRLHKSQKTDPNDKVSRTVIDAVTTEKASTVNFTIMPIAASRSSAIQRYRDLHEIRKNNLNDEIPITSTKIIQKINNMNGITADVNKKIRTATTVIPYSSTSTEKLLSVSSKLGCTASMIIFISSLKLPLYHI